MTQRTRRTGRAYICWMLAWLWLLSGCTGGGTAGTRSAKRKALLQKWLPDIPATKREEMVGKLLPGAIRFCDNVRKGSDVPLIAANAAAARDMLLATKKDLWSEAPIALGAVLVVWQSPSGPHVTLRAGAVDLTRGEKADHIIAIGLPPQHGKRLDIRLCEVWPEPVLMFDTSIAHPVDIVPLEAALAGSTEPDANGVRHLVVRRPAGKPSRLRLPDPAKVRMCFSVVNRLGRHSNAVPVIRIDMPAAKGSYPRQVFDGKLW